MVAIKIIRLLHVISFLIITSQLLYYVFLMGDALKMVNIESFIDERKIVDPMVRQRHIPFYYAALLLGIILMVMHYRQWNSYIFITTAIATVMLITELIVAIKVNMPINTMINEYPKGATDIHIETLRLKWIHFIKLRGLISMAGFIALLVGLVFGKR